MSEYPTDPDPVTRRARAIPWVVVILVAIFAALVALVMIQLDASRSVATRNSRTAAIAIEGARRNCDQVQAISSAPTECAVDPENLPKPVTGQVGPMGRTGLTGPQGPAPPCMYTPGQCQGSPGPPGKDASPPPAPSPIPGPPGQDAIPIPGPPGSPGAPGEMPSPVPGPPGPACPDGWALEQVEWGGALRLVCSRPAPPPPPSPEPSPEPAPSPSPEGAARAGHR